MCTWGWGVCVCVCVVRVVHLHTNSCVRACEGPARGSRGAVMTGEGLPYHPSKWKSCVCMRLCVWGGGGSCGTACRWMQLYFRRAYL